MLNSQLILCSDLVWRNSDTLTAGHEIIAFDEAPVFMEGKKAARCYTKSVIIDAQKVTSECAELLIGEKDYTQFPVDCYVLCWVNNRSRRNLFLDNIKRKRSEYNRCSGLAYIRAMDLKVGDKLAFFQKPWFKEYSNSAGWLEGIYDGEGSLSRSTGDDRIPSWKVSISQNEGCVLDRIAKELSIRNFAFYRNYRKCQQIVLTGGWIELTRFLGEIKPERLFKKFESVLDTMPAFKQDYTFKVHTISNIKKCGNVQYNQINTSTNTSIINGYFICNKDFDYSVP